MRGRKSLAVHSQGLKHRSEPLFLTIICMLLWPGENVPSFFSDSTLSFVLRPYEQQYLPGTSTHDPLNCRSLCEDPI